MPGKETIDPFFEADIRVPFSEEILKQYAFSFWQTRG